MATIVARNTLPQGSAMCRRRSHGSRRPRATCEVVPVVPSQYLHIRSIALRLALVCLAATCPPTISPRSLDDHRLDALGKRFVSTTMRGLPLSTSTRVERLAAVWCSFGV